MEPAARVAVGPGTSASRNISASLTALLEEVGKASTAAQSAVHVRKTPEQHLKRQWWKQMSVDQLLLSTEAGVSTTAAPPPVSLSVSHSANAAQSQASSSSSLSACEVEATAPPAAPRFRHRTPPRFSGDFDVESEEALRNMLMQSRAGNPHRRLGPSRGLSIPQTFSPVNKNALAASSLHTIRWIGETTPPDTLTRVLWFTEHLTEWPCDTLTVAFLYFERMYHSAIGLRLPQAIPSWSPAPNWNQHRSWRPSPLPKPSQPLLDVRASSHSSRTEVKIQPPDTLPNSPAHPCKALALPLRDRARMLSSDGNVFYLLAVCLLLAFKVLDDQVPKNIEWQKALGIPIGEVNALERVILAELEFWTTYSDCEFQQIQAAVSSAFVRE